MGLHTGAAELRDGDYYGPSLNRAARLMSVAHGGQVTLSHATEELLRDGLDDGVELIDLGEHRLRDLSRAEHVFQLAAPGLVREFPRLQSLDAFPTNLPVQVTSFVGRERDIDAVADRGRPLGSSPSSASAVSGRRVWPFRWRPRCCLATRVAHGCVSWRPQVTPTPWRRSSRPPSE